MNNNSKQYVFITVLITILSSFTCTAVAETVDEIIEAQKELNQAAKEREKARLAQEKLLEETKDAITMGNKEYERTCSLCHGFDAKGNGAYAFALINKPADLTQIKKNNNGVFPYSKLHKIIDGRDDIESHGTRIMPIWGDRFNSESWLDTRPQNSETLARGRIFELLLYLETIQK